MAAPKAKLLGGKAAKDVTLDEAIFGAEPNANLVHETVRAELNARRAGTRGAKTTPPPVNCGARMVPARARPVPFWRHGFARPPETRPRVFAPRVPARRAFSSARTVSWTRFAFGSAPKTASSSVTSFAALPPRT